MARLFTFLKPHKSLLLQLIVVNVFLSAMLTVAPLVIKLIVDRVIIGQQYQRLLPYLALLLLVTGIRAAMTYFYTYGQHKMGQLVMTDVRSALYQKLLALPFSFYDREQTGRLMSRISSDVESTRIFLSQIMVESMSHILTTILVAHRLATAQRADQIIVLRDGQIVEHGTHAELDAAGGQYHHVLKMQQMSAQETMAGV